MGSAFLHGQGGGGGAQVAIGTFKPDEYVLSYTVQLSTDFVPDYIIIAPVGRETTGSLMGTMSMKYDKANDAWSIGYKTSSSTGSIGFYTKDSISTYFAEFVYDSAAGTIAITGATGSYSTNYWPFASQVTYQWVMWKE